MTVLATAEAGGKEFWRAVQSIVLFFYANNNLLASMRPKWLQVKFDFLTELYKWIGLQIKVVMRLGMVCCPFCGVGLHFEDAYVRHVTG